MSDKVQPERSTINLSSGTGMLPSKGVDKREDIGQGVVGDSVTRPHLRRNLAFLAAGLVLQAL